MTPNLKKLYGKKYRIDYERKVDGTPINRQAPFTMQLKSTIGHVYVHSDTHLGFATDRNCPSLRKVPELELIQDGADGQNYIFERELLPTLAKKLKLRTRRQVVLTDEQKEILRQRLEDIQARRQHASRTEQKIDALPASSGSRVLRESKVNLVKKTGPIIDLGKMPELSKSTASSF
jgi:hypothetical protein